MNDDTRAWSERFAEQRGPLRRLASGSGVPSWAVEMRNESFALQLGSGLN